MIKIHIPKSKYTKRHFEILNLSLSQIYSLPFYKMSIEELDFVLIRLKDFGITGFFIIEIILKKSLRSPVINYVSLFQFMIIHYLSSFAFTRAKKLLLIYEEFLFQYQPVEKNYAFYFCKKIKKLIKVIKREDFKEIIKNLLKSKKYKDPYLVFLQVLIFDNKEAALYLNREIKNMKNLFLKKSNNNVI